jgi:hypothetical protein
MSPGERLWRRQFHITWLLLVVLIVAAAGSRSSLPSPLFPMPQAFVNQGDGRGVIVLLAVLAAYCWFLDPRRSPGAIAVAWVVWLMGASLLTADTAMAFRSADQLGEALRIGPAVPAAAGAFVIAACCLIGLSVLRQRARQ